MKAIDLIKSIYSGKQTKWGQEVTINGINKSLRGAAWITAKQDAFLYDLVVREQGEENAMYYDNMEWEVNGYIAKLSPTAGNGCRQVRFLRKDHIELK